MTSNSLINTYTYTNGAHLRTEPQISKYSPRLQNSQHSWWGISRSCGRRFDVLRFVKVDSVFESGFLFSFLVREMDLNLILKEIEAFLLLWEVE
jgi:hypothetical protein